MKIKTTQGLTRRGGDEARVAFNPTFTHNAPLSGPLKSVSQCTTPGERDVSRLFGSKRSLRGFHSPSDSNSHPPVHAFPNSQDSQLSIHPSISPSVYETPSPSTARLYASPIPPSVYSGVRLSPIRLPFNPSRHPFCFPLLSTSSRCHRNITPIREDSLSSGCQRSAVPYSPSGSFLPVSQWRGGPCFRRCTRRLG